MKQSEQLAIEFGKVLKAWLTDNQFNELVRLNNEDGKNASFCYSHSYCDANMAMDEAFTKVLGRQFVFADGPANERQNEKDTELINVAWSIAKQNNFYAPVSYIIRSKNLCSFYLSSIDALFVSHNENPDFYCLDGRMVEENWRDLLKGISEADIQLVWNTIKYDLSEVE